MQIITDRAAEYSVSDSVLRFDERGFYRNETLYKNGKPVELRRVDLNDQVRDILFPKDAT